MLKELQTPSIVARRIKYNLQYAKHNSLMMHNWQESNLTIIKIHIKALKREIANWSGCRHPQIATLESRRRHRHIATLEPKSRFKSKLPENFQSWISHRIARISKWNHINFSSFARWIRRELHNKHNWVERLKEHTDAELSWTIQRTQPKASWTISKLNPSLKCCWKFCKGQFSLFAMIQNQLYSIIIRNAIGNLTKSVNFINWHSIKGMQDKK